VGPNRRRNCEAFELVYPVRSPGPGLGAREAARSRDSRDRNLDYAGRDQLVRLERPRWQHDEVVPGSNLGFQGYRQPQLKKSRHERRRVCTTDVAALGLESSLVARNSHRSMWRRCGGWEPNFRLESLPASALLGARRGKGNLLRMCEMTPSLKSELVLALVLSPVIVYSLLMGLQFASISPGYGSEWYRSPLGLMVVLSWMLSLLTPLLVPIYLWRRIGWRRLTVLVLFEVAAYAIWWIFLGSYQSYPPPFYFTYWLPPTLSTMVGYALILSRNH